MRYPDYRKYHFQSNITRLKQSPVVPVGDINATHARLTLQELPRGFAYSAELLLCLLSAPSVPDHLPSAPFLAVSPLRILAIF